MQDYRNIKVWRKAHELAMSVYRTTAQFPTEERYGLTSQMRRAAVSIPSNIVEGRGRHGDAEFRRFLRIAFGSASELEYQLMLARDLGFMTDGYDELANDVEEVKRMLATFVKKLSADG
ncbi:MAG: four helix bundle protein [Alphaproteobacteria bacterium]